MKIVRVMPMNIEVCTARKTKKTLQSGFSLIELMVALGLGLFILAGIIQVFVGSRQSFEVIQGQSSMQEAGRFGLYFIEQSAVHAGFINAGVFDNDYAQSFLNIIDGDNLYAAHWPQDTANGFSGNASVVGSPVVAAAAPGTATLSFRMDGDPNDPMRDCAGNLVSSVEGVSTTTIFYIDAQNQLNCQVNAGPAVALVSGIENMQVLYGVSNSRINPQAVRYYTAATMTPLLWQRVVAVRVGFIAVSSNAPLPRISVNNELLGTVIASAADGRVRQVFSKTIAIRAKI